MTKPPTAPPPPKGGLAEASLRSPPVDGCTQRGWRVLRALAPHLRDVVAHARRVLHVDRADVALAALTVLDGELVDEDAVGVRGARLVVFGRAHALEPRACGDEHE